MRIFIIIVLVAIALGASSPQGHDNVETSRVCTGAEYMLITDIQPYAVGIDLVTVCDGDGDESQFFADSYTYIGGEIVLVTYEIESGEIVAVEEEV